MSVRLLEEIITKKVLADVELTKLDIELQTKLSDTQKLVIKARMSEITVLYNFCCELLQMIYEEANK